MKSRPRCLASISLGIALLQTASYSQTGQKVTSRSAIDAAFAAYEKGAHTGPAEIAIVTIRVTGTNPNGTPIAPRYGNGLVLRCDGFIAVPFDLFNVPADSTPSAPAKLSVRVTIRPGTDHEQHVVFPRRSQYFVDGKRRIGFTVFKLDGTVHIPATKTMLPDTLKVGDQVQVVWREGDPNGQSGRLVHKVAQLAGLPEGTAGDGLVEDTTEHPGRIRLAEPVNAVPPGALVLGPDGVVIGIMPGARESNRDSFISMANLNSVTNCVGAVPNPDSDFRVNNPEPAELKEGESAKGSMVKVPGGPVIMPPMMLTVQPDMNGQETACVAPFEIDRLEVTNTEYLAFWNSFSEKQRLNAQFRNRMFPLTWATRGEPFPASIGNLPVLGISPAGAMAYARSKGKRLPTPYEWVKAALGPYGENKTPEWLARYNSDQVKTWKKLVELHSEYIRTSIGLLEFARHPVDENGKPLAPFANNLLHIPWIIAPSYGRHNNTREVRYSFDVTSALTDQMNAIWQSPSSVIAVGERSYDVSPYGARDMLLNATELYLANPGPQTIGGTQYAFLAFTAPPERLFRDSGFFPLPLPPIGIHSYGHVGKLSRLYARRLQPADRYDPVRPVPIEETIINLNIQETMLVTQPFERWFIGISQQYDSNHYDHWFTEADLPPTALTEAARRRMLQAYPWASRILNYSREFGIPPATEGTLLLPPQMSGGGYTLGERFFIPVGFRCAR
jgi:formylglycine-generating enzyme required for sulfatase activity